MRERKIQRKGLGEWETIRISPFFDVRLAAHVSNGLESRIRPVVGIPHWGLIVLIVK